MKMAYLVKMANVTKTLASYTNYFSLSHMVIWSSFKCSPRSIMGRFMETLWDLKPENEGGNCFNLFRRCHRWAGWFLWWGTLIVTGASRSHSWSDAPIFAFSQCWGFHNFVWWSFSPYFEVSSHTMVFTMLQCSNTRWTRLLALSWSSLYSSKFLFI